MKTLTALRAAISDFGAYTWLVKNSIAAKTSFDRTQAPGWVYGLGISDPSIRKRDPAWVWGLLERVGR